MKRIFFILLYLATLSLAFEPTYYTLEDFIKNAERNPNKCVNKGVTYKCVGYDEIEGAIFNTKTHRHYTFIHNVIFDSYIEYQCENFYVEIDDDIEKILCDEITPIKEINCISSSKSIKTIDYDELGIIFNEKTTERADPSLCRNSFHRQYGSNEGKPYVSRKPQRVENVPEEMPNSEDMRENQKFSKDIDYVLNNVASVETTDGTLLGGRRTKAYTNDSPLGDGLAGMISADGGGIATKAKGSIKTPSERDIHIDANNDSRTTSDIAKVVRQRTPGLRHIYNKFLKKKPSFSGTVSLKCIIAPSGEITKISTASSTTGYSDFDNEIKNAVSRWKFSKVQSGSTTVTIPFAFSE